MFDTVTAIPGCADDGIMPVGAVRELGLAIGGLCPKTRLVTAVRGSLMAFPLFHD